MQYEEIAKKDEKKKKFGELLISNVKKKFDHELNSAVYAAAAVLNVSKLYLWYQRPIAKARVNLGLGSLLNLVVEFKKQIEQNDFNSSSSAKNSSTQKSVAADEAYRSELDQVEISQKEFSIENSVEKERENFVNILKNHNFTNKTHFDEFWFGKRKELPHPYNLCLMLYNIPSSMIRNTLKKVRSDV
jgi:hypothetical protein